MQGLVRKTRVILDCDNSFGLPGRDIDDGLALLYLLGRAEIDLLGMTLCFGNASLPAVARASRRLLSRIGRDGLPLKMGASGPFISQERTEAAAFLLQMASAYPGELTIVATGPLSNLANAAALDPEFFEKLAGIYIMGGCRAPIRFGRVACKELNLSADKTAALTVLNASCPVHLFPAETCMQMPFSWREYRHTAGLKKSVRSAIWKWMFCFGARYRSRQIYLWDMLPALALTHAGFFDTRQVQVDFAASDLDEGLLAFRPGRAIFLAEKVCARSELLDIAVDTWQRAAARTRLPELSPAFENCLAGAQPGR